MRVQIFQSEKGGYALTEDDTGACLPSDRGPWVKKGSVDLEAPDNVEACISHHRFFLTDTLPAAKMGMARRMPKGPRRQEAPRPPMLSATP
jgi:hypothetical protein